MDGWMDGWVGVKRVRRCDERCKDELAERSNEKAS